MAKRELQAEETANSEVGECLTCPGVREVTVVEIQKTVYIILRTLAII